HRPIPGDNVITYGTNRLSAYHPYLRLAEAHLLAGHPETAREALVRSAERAKEPAEERGALDAEVEAALGRRKSIPPESRDLTEVVRSLAARLAEVEVRLERLEGGAGEKGVSK